MPDFPALHHVAVTVRDLEVSGPWYRALIGVDPALDERTDAGLRRLVWALDGGTLFGIHQHDREIAADQFTEFRAGLDHVGFGCADRAARVYSGEGKPRARSATMNRRCR